jgi:predicted small lipoprotein YifL
MPVVARLGLAIAAVVTLATVGACGPEQPPPATAGTAAPTTNRTSTPATAAAAVTPERLCGTVSIADVARMSGFHQVARPRS